jgi:hypothetical protein
MGSAPFYSGTMNFLQEYETQFVGSGGVLAVLSVDRLNVYLAAVIAVLTIIHLILKIRSDTRKK